jgi:hypothetical protein
MAEYQLYGRQFVEWLRGYAPKEGAAMLMNVKGNSVHLLAFDQTVQSAATLLFATAGGFVGVACYRARPRADVERE